MRFTPIYLAGAYLVEAEPIADARGFFARTWCQVEFASKALNTNLVQCSISYNKTRGTLRGMHYQKAPYAETKLVRCTQGAIYDVVIDLRADSETYTKWFGVELTANNRKALYVPEGFAHGFITLVDDSEVSYQISAFFQPESAAGVRWDDPVFGIQWPIQMTMISERDESYKDFELQR